MGNLAGTEGGRVLVVGSGRCVWDDLAAYEAAFGPVDVPPAASNGGPPVMAVNFVGTVWPTRPLAYWASLHHDAWLWAYYRQARLNGMQDHAVVTIARRPCEHVRLVIPADQDMILGTSGLFAVRAAKWLGFDEVVVLGIPLDTTGHFYDRPGYRTTYDETQIRDAWLRCRDSGQLQGVTAMSGRPREWLGGPDGL